MRAVLYDIHGNLPALERVLAEAEEAGAEGYLLGGDYISPLPDLTRAVLERLRALDDAIWIRGNGERWLVEPPPNAQFAEVNDVMREQLADEVEALYALPGEAELDGVLFCHGCPLADDESFAASPQPGEERMLAGVSGRTIVFGHSHLQFRRPGRNRTQLLNPGSAGMPLDGDRRAAWALFREGGDFEFRRTAYDVERVAAAFRSFGGWFGELAARRIERGAD